MQGKLVERHSAPAVNQLSMIVVVILLGYLLLPYLEIPVQQISMRIFGVELVYEVQARTMVASLLAGLAAVGTHWLLAEHPNYRGQPLFLYTILPTLTAWILTVPLAQLEITARWWGLFFIGGALLMAVFTAEYISLDTRDKYYPFASMGLTALSFALYLFLAISLRAADIRLFTVSTTLALAGFLIALRSLYLRLNAAWHPLWSLAIALVVAQIAAGMHYLPLSPILFAIIMVALCYALVNVAETVIRKEPLRRVWIETGVLAVIMLLIGFFINRFLP